MIKKFLSLLMVVSCSISMITPSVSARAEEVSSKTVEEAAFLPDNPQEVIYYNEDNNQSLFVSDEAIKDIDKDYELTSKGNINNLVVFVRFKGQRESDVYKSINSDGNGSISEIKNAFNASSNSLYDYTKAISNNKFSVKSDFYPLNSAGNVVTYEDINPLSYYQTTTNSSTRKSELIIRTLNAVASQVKNKSKFDYNKDGILDYVTIVVPNMGDWGEALWPTCLTYYSPVDIQNLGMKMRKVIFITTPYFNYYGKSSSMYRVIAHEAMHMIGFNDLYVNSGQQPLGNWSVMVNNNGHPTIYEKSSYGKWGNNIKSLSKAGTYTITNNTINSSTCPSAYKIAIPGSSSYYMIEYRNKNADIYEKGIDASGLLLYKVNPSMHGNLTDSEYEVQKINPTVGSVLNSSSGKYQISLNGTSEKVSFTINLKSMSKERATFTVTGGILSVNSLKSSVASPQYVGTKVKLTTSASGGSGSLQYRYTIQSGTKKVVTTYSKNNYYTWTPKSAGTYTIKVEVKDAKGTVKNKTISYVIKNKPLVISSLKSSVASPQYVGTKVKLTTSASGGSGSLQYRYTIQSGTKKVVTTYSKNNYYTWTPKSAGTYTVKVEVKDAKGTVKNKTISYVIKNKPLGISSLKSSVASPQYVGTKVKLTTAASGGSGSLQYRYTIQLGTKKVVTTYSKNNYYTWTPKSAGTYTIKVEVKDAKGTVKSKTASYVIKNKPLGIIAFKSSISSPQYVGTKVKLTTSASGGSGSLQYRYTIQLGTKKVVTTYSKNNYYTWTPKSAGTYTIKVEVKDGKGTVKSKTASYVIKNKPLGISSFKSSVSSPQYVGAKVKLTTSASGGSGSLQYRYTIQSGTKKVVTTYSKNNYYTWTPKSAGTYTVKVEVKDGKGTVKSKTASYVIKNKPLTITSVNIPENITTGDDYKFSASAKGTGRLEYKFSFFYQGGGSLTMESNYSTSNAVLAKFIVKGDWLLKVEVKDDTGKIVSYKKLINVK